MVGRNGNPVGKSARGSSFWKVLFGVLPLLSFAGAAEAARLIISVSLNGGTPWTYTTGGALVLSGSPVSVLAGQSINVSVTVTTSGPSAEDDWESTSWQIANSIGTWSCADTTNFTSTGTHTTSFSVIAPAASGTYNFYARAHDGNSCGTGNGGPSPTVTLSNAITVLPPATNPTLPEACGLDIVLVLDVSGSIGSNITDVKNAANAFVNAFLPGTPTLIGLVSFSDTGTVLENLTSDSSALLADIAGLTSGGWTNWQDALLDAKGLLEGGMDRDDSIHPDLIVFVTDGDPTASTAGASTSTQPNVHLYPAVVAANATKTSAATEPIRILTIGVGGAPTVARLVAISGPVTSPPAALSPSVDVVTGSFAGLADMLSDLALTLCGGSITVHKVIDADGNLATTGDQFDGVGWTFDANVDAPDSATPSSGATDGMGLINFSIDLGGDNAAVVDIVETLQSNYDFVSASCVTGGNPVGTPGSNQVSDIPVGPLDIITCTFYNKPHRGACCNTNVPGGSCTDNVAFYDCAAPGMIWTYNESCANVSCCSSDALCADADPCTTDACVPGMGCVNTPIVCNDNDPCTIDECLGGSCVYNPVVCGDNNDPCTDSVCDPAGENGNCDLTVPVNNGGPCDDGLWCTVDDVCDDGDCVGGSARDCSDGVMCTNDSCDEANDQCLHLPSDAKCSDGLYCNGMETCHPDDDCQPGTAPCNAPFKCDEDGDRCVMCLTDGQCDDGLYCNGMETCDTVSGTCQPGTNPCPPDSVDCTIDSCDEMADACLHTPNHAFCQNGLYCDGMEICDPIQGCIDGDDPCVPPFKCDESGDRCVMCLTDGQCDDGLFCNGMETCDTVTGMCQPGSDPCPPDSVDCTMDSCDEANDVCLHVPDHAFCQNGIYCDGMEICDPVQGCIDGDDPCSPPLKCDENGDRCVECLTDGQCNDGLYCNGEETCDTVSGTCTPGTDPCPPDNIACTFDSCDEANDACLHVPDNSICQNGLYCDGMEICDLMQGCIDGDDPCVPPFKCDESGDRCVLCLSDGQCDDGVFCNGQETCDLVSGTCQPGSDPCPDDGIACTTTVCLEDSDSCTHVDNCVSDGLYCNGNEVCNPNTGLCESTGDPCTPPLKCDEGNDRCVMCLTDAQCDDGLYCNGMETCNLTTGLCQAGTNPCPPDGVACTIEECNEATDSCQQTLDHASCQNGLFCDGAEVCDPVQGCIPGENPCPPDSIDCTLDGCNEDKDVCTRVPQNKLCSDGLFCNGAEICDPQVGCVPGTPPCMPDAVACTIDVCDEKTDSCLHTPSDLLCSDGVFCNGVEICDAVAGCLAGTPPCPADSVACTIDTCDEATTSCLHTPSNDLCDDGLFCNGAETCDPILGCRPGTAPCVPDNIPCTIDSCDEAANACLHTPSDSLCSDERFCNGYERCDPVLGCQDMPDPFCTHLDDDCNVGVCDPVVDACVKQPTNSGLSCSGDGLFCTGNEVCVAGACVSQGNPCPSGLKCDEANDRCVQCLTASQCNDNDICTDDICTSAGLCSNPENDVCGSDGDRGACCNRAEGTCVDNVRRMHCPEPLEFSEGASCSEIDCVLRIPTVSEWGLAVLTLLLLIGAKTHFRSRRAVA